MTPTERSKKHPALALGIGYYWHKRGLDDYPSPEGEPFDTAISGLLELLADNHLGFGWEDRDMAEIFASVEEKIE